MTQALFDATTAMPLLRYAQTFTFPVVRPLCFLTLIQFGLWEP